jgi:hypothetical protein
MKNMCNNESLADGSKIIDTDFYPRAVEIVYYELDPPRGPIEAAREERMDLLEKGGYMMKEATIRTMLMVIVISLICAAAPTRLLAEEYEKFYDQFVELEKWKRNDPEGAAVAVPGMNMLQAMCTYTKDKSELNAMIMIGTAAMTSPFTAQGEMKYETEDGKAVSEEIDGFMVFTMYDKKNKSGAVTVVLLPGEEENALFVLAFEGLPEKEGREMAMKFNWKEMKKRVESLE